MRLVIKEIVLLAVFIIFVSGRIFPQTITIGFGSGIGKYSMSGLKDFNRSIMDQLPFDSELTSDFPPYLFYEPLVMARFGNLSAGLVYSFQSTGSRISAKDYSGEYRFDMKVRSSAPGLLCEYEVLGIKRYSLSPYASFRGVFSRLQASEMLTIDDNILTDESQELKAFSWLVEPGISLSGSFGIVGVGIAFGYAIDLGGNPFHSVGNEDNILKNPVSGQEVKPDWNGIRAGITLSVRLQWKRM
jgi:hypothetical protein